MNENLALMTLRFITKRKIFRMVKRTANLQKVFILFFTFVFISSFSTRNSMFYIKPVFTPEFMLMETPWADSVLTALDLEEKIGQLLMVQVFSSYSDDQLKEIEKDIEKNKIGGVLFSKGGPVRQAKLTNRFQHLAKVPLMVAMDAEWSLGQRLDSVMSYPYQMTLGAINDNSLIYTMGGQIAGQCKRLGVHMNFAPVVDINNNPNNPVINYRSFGEDRDNVMAKGLMYMMGMQDNNLLTTIKHFPGHGDTEKDSHHTLPQINHNKAHLDSLELYPFEQLINNGASGVMIAHLNIPALDSTTNLASTLSPDIVTGLLKRKMGFGGLVVTDALTMKGVSDYFGPGDLEVLAFKAGNDILLMPTDVEKAIHEIKKEVRRGRISEEEIDKRCHKILKAKEWAGVHLRKEIATQNLVKDLNKTEYQVLDNTLIKKSLTLLKNSRDILPFKNLENLKIAVISVNADQKTEFQKTFDFYLESDHFYLNASDHIAAKGIMDTLGHYNTIVVSVHNTNNSSGQKYGITQETARLVQKIGLSHHNVVLALFGNPYALRHVGPLDGFTAVCMAFQSDARYESFMAQALFGGIGFQGKIPVNAHADIKLHTGYHTYPGRLSFDLPESIGMNSDTLAKIDRIVNKAIKDQATPGCQIVVAKKGVVVYNKAFGHHTYLKKKAVQHNDVYDIASLTKIFATTTAMMKLHEDGRVNVDTVISAYLHYLDTTNKKDLTIVDIMAHQARLPGWIPFYMSTLESLYPERDIFSRNFSNQYPLQFHKNTYITRFLKYVDGIYTDERDGLHNTKVADGMYILDSYKDSIFYKIGSCELRESNGYKYSDLGFYLLYDLIERETNQPFADYVYNHFYKKIGASYTTFKPLEKMERARIVPTEDDLIFRKQLVHGHVHDPGAAMLGGVCGHAGLFSSAIDLAKIMQMWINKGAYGYVQYLKPETIERFTCMVGTDKENRRGMGFDKPSLDKDGPSPSSKLCSSNSFGHTGFTGTLAWADPDNDLIFIFLSNRVHPDQNNNILSESNVRTKIQDLIYRADGY
jgi:beta-N-acetylhexosaminidase